MPLKDYYSVLELPPSSGGDEVKKAYRRLALRYHPDKNPGDAYAAAQFAEIKEAYETLTHPGRKEQYLQQRWYAQSIGQRTRQPVITPVTVLKIVLDLDKYVRTLDHHRLDQGGLQQYLLELLSDEHVQKLNSFNEPAINREIILSVLKTTHGLSLEFVSPVVGQLQKLAAGDPASSDQLERFLRERRQADFWERRKIWFILAAVLLTTLLIYFMAKK